MKELEYEKLGLKYAAIFHDIGKFYYRAKHRMKHEKLSKIVLNEILPKKIVEKSDFLIFRTKPEKGEEDYGLIQNNRNALILKIADALASQERKQDSNEKNVFTAPLESIFSNLFKGDNKKKLYLIPQKIDLNNFENLYPVEKESIETFKKQSLRSGESYDTIFKETLTDEFDKEFIKGNKLNDDFSAEDEEKFYIKLLSCMEKYLTTIPSASYNSSPDISLYDHSRVTTAIAICLYNLNKDYNELKSIKEILTNSFKEYVLTNKSKEERLNFLESEENKILREKDFMLIGGDFPSIQKFVFRTRTSKAAKTLKGRSSYLSILNIIVPVFIIKKLGLDYTNIIYSGGGRFYILSHKVSYDNIREIERTVNKELRRVLGGELRVVLDSIELNYIDFDKSVFANKWMEINRRISQRKYKPFYHDELREEFDKIFFPEIEDFAVKQEDVCENCNVRRTQKSEDDGIKLCSLCNSFSELSKKLKTRKSSFKRLLGDELMIFKDDLKVFYDLEFNFDNYDYLPTFLLPRGVPENSVDEFDTNYLGVLKMDVDDLGNIFSQGLGDDKTISRLAHLSQLMKIFFGGIIPKLFENDKDYYLVYSGGDDLLVYGSSKIILEKSYVIYENFKKFTANNDRITLSAGFELIKKKHPLLRAVKTAEDYLEKSKSNEYSQIRKNAITILGQKINWNTFNSNNNGLTHVNEVLEGQFNLHNEFEIFWNLYKGFKEIIEKKYPKSILSKIFTSFEDSVYEKNKNRIIWRMHYIFREYVKKEKPSEEDIFIKNVCDLIERVSLFNFKSEDNEVFNIKIIPLAAKMVSMELKKQR